ncbi:WD domain-containing protein [Xylona heveae TC161]|uniref:WD domain-containing protein n=1 Tax=Xylona heveae (strain CBS 132557 / TC161) TaxID=1328760 RepID=A0A165ICX3_XYLHT|nr:WD domain-containing protein [Xylona heveae TC161]KZF24720.1 WD domain-containing protein [Xylona heveae TC161]
MAPEPSDRVVGNGSELEESVTDENDTKTDDGTATNSDEEEEDDDEPVLKYARVTGHLASIYRNGDATSTFLVAGDKMIIGTHNGNVHVLGLPSFQPLRVYKAHSASVTSISISPFPPPPSTKPDAVSRLAAAYAPTRPTSSGSSSATAARAPRQPSVPNTPSNSIHIATSSIDGNVCVTNLIDPKDVMVRNFSRPVQAVALSPNFKSDRSYLSGGLAGNLILTTGGRPGTSTSNTVGSSTIAASGWLGSLGLGPNNGKDTVLHAGEGPISTIKWSLSGKFVVWMNEHGVKIMRSNLYLENIDQEYAWKRIGHIDRPRHTGWDDMAGVWKGRVEWVDEDALENDEAAPDTPRASQSSNGTGTRVKQSLGSLKANKPEKLLVGWGDTIWVVNVYPGGAGTGRDVGERLVGRADIVTKLRTDCIISGLSLYTPSLLLVLAYITPDDEDDASSSAAGETPRRGIHHRQRALQPELRLINIASPEKEEVSVDTLSVSRYGGLSAVDYHLGVLPSRQVSETLQTQRRVLEAIGSGLWDAGLNATKIFGSNVSVRSLGLQSDKATESRDPSNSSASKSLPGKRYEPPAAAATPGLKIYIHSPYDCVLAVKRDLSDHLAWLEDREKFGEAWELIDQHPEVVSVSPEKASDSTPSTPTVQQGSLADFFADDASQTTLSANRPFNSAVEKEKRRIGEMWIEQLIDSGEWATAGIICGKVLGTSSRWEHWVWTFAQANKFDEITPYIPTTQLQPALPSLVYEVVLGHYIAHDRQRLKELLDQWPPDLFDISSVTAAISGKLRAGDVRESDIRDGERGRDWRILMESLAKLYLADSRLREALQCYIRLQDADAAMSLIKEYRLLDAVSADIPGIILLRVSKDQLDKAPMSELESATAEPIALLVDEAHQGVVRPETVVKQLQESDHLLFLFFYLRALWKSDTVSTDSHAHQTSDRIADEGKVLVDEFADLAIDLFAIYDRELLMQFLKTSQSYNFPKACAICEKRDYVPELVYLLSKTGEMKRALFLIIDKLRDVSQAISFAKAQDDPDLWDDLLNYSMDKSRFIRGLLEEVGTAIDPVTLVRRIPEGLEIEGLRDGLSRMIRDYEIQHSISEGVARVLRSEVATGMDTLRSGQKRGIAFDIVHEDAATETSEAINGSNTVNEKGIALREPGPGHCVGCQKAFSINEKETLIGFACGHVFHLSCLISHGEEEEEPALGETSGSPEADSGYWSRSVGAKVTHARIIREKIPDGCPLCVHKEEEDM